MDYNSVNTYTMKTEYNEAKKFYHLAADDGMVITSWRETDDIRDYSSALQVYCPASTDIGIYYEITIEQDNEYTVLLEQAIEED